MKFGIIRDVEASRAIRQAEVGAAKMAIKAADYLKPAKPTFGSGRS